MRYTVAVVVVLLALACGALGGLPNGITTEDPNDEIVQSMASFAVSELGSEYALVKVKKAEKRLVAGYVYAMKIDVTRTPPAGSMKTYTCKVEVYERAWEDFLDLTSFKCSNAE